MCRWLTSLAAPSLRASPQTWIACLVCLPKVALDPATFPRLCRSSMCHELRQSYNWQFAYTSTRRKQTLTSKAAELEELEAKLKATEERLAKSRNASPARQANVGAHRLPPSQQPADPTQKSGHPLAQKPSYPPDRPPTARADTQALMSGMPGHMPPPTPQEYNSGNNEYVVVDKNASGYGQSVR